MKVLNLLTSGSFGGIEVYCKDIGLSSEYENGFCFLFGEGGVYELMKQQNLQVYSFFKYPKLSEKRLKKIWNIAKKYDIVVVHHADPYLQLYYLFLKRLLPSKKYVQVIHSCYDNYSFESYGIVKKVICDGIEKIVLKQSDLILAVSEAVKQSMEKRFAIGDSRIHVVYNGIGMDKLQAGEQAVLKKHDPIEILYVGRLKREKGVDILLKALPDLKKEVDISVKIVGDGSYREELEKYVQKKELSTIVSFEGFQSNVGKYLKECDIFVYPSRWEEAFGISIVEAMAYGRICIANAVGGIPEIIENGINGFLSDTPDEKGILIALKKAVALIEEGEDMNIRQNARNTAKRFSIKNACNNLYKEFLDIL